MREMLRNANAGNVAEFAFAHHTLRLFCAKLRTISCKKMQVMRVECELPDMSSLVFGGNGRQKTQFRQKKVQDMNGECELRDISLLVFDGNCAFFHTSHQGPVAKCRAIRIRPS